MKMKYVAYIRVASKNSMCIENQKESIKRYAEENNINIDKYYVDNGYSGTNFDRPGIKELLTDIEDKNVSGGIIVKEISIIARIQELVNYVINKSEKNNLKLLSVNGDIESYINSYKFYGNQFNKYKGKEVVKLKIDKNKPMRVAMYCRVGNDKLEEDDKLKKISFNLQEKLKTVYKQPLLDKNNYSFINSKLR